MAMWMRRVMMRFGDGLRDYSACINFRKNTKKVSVKWANNNAFI